MKGADVRTDGVKGSEEHKWVRVGPLRVALPQMAARQAVPSLSVVCKSSADLDPLQVFASSSSTFRCLIFSC